jgi:pyruvate dehydrogenase E1 component beta subunit
MLLAAIHDPDPVIFMEPKRIYRAGREEVPEDPPFQLGNGTRPERITEILSKARVAREGGDLAIITYGATVPLSLQAADRLEQELGIKALVLDLRSLYPLDVDAITAAASRCGRAVVVHEAPRTAGLGAEISSLIHERVMLDLEAPVGRVTGFDVPFPQFANEDDYLPSVDRIVTGAKKVLDF